MRGVVSVALPAKNANAGHKKTARLTGADTACYRAFNLCARILPARRAAVNQNSPVAFLLINTTKLFIIRPMNSKQMKKWLEQQGATFAPGKGSHLKVFLNGRQSTLPMHGTAELGKGLEAAIKRQLGLK